MTLALSSASTLAEIQAAYDDNLDYDLSGDAAKCRQFIQACRMLIRRRPEETQNGTSRIRDDYHKLQVELTKAETWLAANDSTASTRAGTRVTHADFTEFRD